MSLLDEAKAAPLQHRHRRGEYTQDEMELAVAWARGEISVKQVAHALGKPMDTGTYAFLAHAIRAAHRMGVWL